MFNIPKLRGHDTLVRALIDLLFNNGFALIYADLEGFQKPSLIYWRSSKEGHIPDVTAFNQNNIQVIFEIETEDSISSEHSVSQYNLFSAFVSTHNAIFYLVVPVGYKNIAMQTLQSNNITADVIEI